MGQFVLLYLRFSMQWFITVTRAKRNPSIENLPTFKSRSNLVRTILSSCLDGFRFLNSSNSKRVSNHQMLLYLGVLLFPLSVHSIFLWRQQESEDNFLQSKCSTSFLMPAFRVKFPTKRSFFGVSWNGTRASSFKSEGNLSAM